MNKRGGFWFWTGLVTILVWGIVLIINLPNFAKLPQDTNFLVEMFIFSLIIGVAVVICIFLNKTFR